MSATDRTMTMTRERMKDIQAVPKSGPIRYRVQTYYRTKDGIVPYRDQLVEIATRKGLAFQKSGGDAAHGWWPALAPLTPAERREVWAAFSAPEAA